MQERPVVVELRGIINSHHGSANSAPYSKIHLKNKENLNQHLFIPGTQLQPGEKVTIKVERGWKYVDRNAPALTPAVTLPATSVETKNEVES